jgi:hypothetical protein
MEMVKYPTADVKSREERGTAMFSTPQTFFHLCIA